MATSITAITATSLTQQTAAPRQFQAVFDVIPFTVALDDDSLAAQNSAEANVTVAGAELGDFVLISSGVDNAGVLIQGYVSATDTVTVITFNTEATDAVTTFANNTTANGVVLKWKDIV